MVSNPAWPVAAGGTGQELRAGPEWEYAPAPESRDIVTIRPEYGLFIGGGFSAPPCGGDLNTINPAAAGPPARGAPPGTGGEDPGLAGAAAGTTSVLKPAETTPLSALPLAEVIQQADLPPGAVNIITGDGRTGRELVAHPGVDKIAFTGSTEVGKEIQRAIAGTGKRLTLDLGGKAANIVFDDAPIDQAVEGIVNGIFFNQGHACCAGSRLLAQESISDSLLDRLTARLETLRLGDPLDKNTDIGAINSREQLDKITSLVAAGEAEGGQRWSPPCPLPARGYRFAPTVFSGVSQSHRIAREEIFGPLLSWLTFP